MQEKVILPENLLLKYLKGELNEEDQIMLDEWLAKAEQNRLLFEYITNDKNLTDELKEFRSSNPDAIKAKLVDIWPPVKVASMRRHIWLRITAAAAVVILLSIGASVWFSGNRQKEADTTSNQNKPIDIAPGKDGAILKLADGKEIVVDNSVDGSLVRQGGTDVIKHGSALQYSNGGTNSTEVVYNTLSTPRGRQFQLVLPDGSRAYLNSASSITFPTSFIGKDRSVKVQGEVYMEIAKDASRSFQISVKGMQLEVLGTEFNINAYEDEGFIKTTLLDGKVKVSSLSNKVAVLIPGQQAQIDRANDIKVSKVVNLEKITSWKNGMFFFEGDDLRTVMNELTRWYNVKVEYKGTVHKLFYAVVGRDESLSTVLEMFEKSGTGHYKVEGETIIVSP